MTFQLRSRLSMVSCSIYGVAVYSGIACLSLGPKLLPDASHIMLSVFMGAIIGGLVFPRILKWYRDDEGQGGVIIRRIPLIAVVSMLGAVGLVPPATREWSIFVAHLTAMGIGLLAAPVFTVLYQNVSSSMRATGYGLWVVCGMVVWQVLNFPGDIETIPLFRSAWRLSVIINALSGICIIPLLLMLSGRHQPMILGYHRPFIPSSDYRIAVLAALGGGLLVYVMIGLLETRLMPAMPGRSMPSNIAILFSGGVFLAGRFMDKDPIVRIRQVLGVCAVMFLLAQPLAVLGGVPYVDKAVQFAAALGQFVCLVALTTYLASVSRSAEEAGRYAALLFGIRGAAIVGLHVFRPLSSSVPGLVMLLGIICAIVFYLLFRRATRALEPGEVVTPLTSDVPTGTACRPSQLDSFLPIVTLLFYYGTIYSARASFSLRPRQAERHLTILSFALIAAAIGGWLVPKLYEWFRRGYTNRTLPTVLLIAPLSFLLLILPLSSAVGYEVWLTSEPTRYLANIGIGALLSVCHYVFYAFAAPKHRGFWVGLANGLGMLGLHLLLKYSPFFPGKEVGEFPSSLFSIYIINTFFIVGMTLLLWRTLPLTPLRPEPEYQPYFRVFEPAKRRSIIFRILGSYLALCLLNGLFEARLFPVLAIQPIPNTDSILPYMYALLAPWFGWYMDGDPERRMVKIMQGWGFFFILTPALSFMGEASYVNDSLQNICSVGSLVLGIVVMTGLAGLSKNAVQAGAFAGLTVGLRILAVYSAKLVSTVPIFGLETTVLCAAAFAFIYYNFCINLHLSEPVNSATNSLSLPNSLSMTKSTEIPDLDGPGVDHNSEIDPNVYESDDPESVFDGIEQTKDEEAVDVNHEQEHMAAIEAFLNKCRLTPREREVTLLLFSGSTTPMIAKELGISNHTVNTHVKNIAEKYGVSGRRGLLVLFASNVK